MIAISIVLENKSYGSKWSLAKSYNIFLIVVLPTEMRFNSVDFCSKVMVIPNLNFGGGGGGLVGWKIETPGFRPQATQLMDTTNQQNDGILVSTMGILLRVFSTYVHIYNVYVYIYILTIYFGRILTTHSDLGIHFQVGYWFPKDMVLYSCWNPRGKQLFWLGISVVHMGVSKNRGTPKLDGFLWKPLLKWMIWGETPPF